MIRHLIFVGSLLAPSAFLSYAFADEATDAMLAPVLNVETNLFQGVEFAQGGGYGVRHGRVEFGNFFIKASAERFGVDWQNLEKLPFASGLREPVSELKRYTIKGHIPYRLDDKRMWLAHLGAEWAYESEMDRALSLQSYLLYSYQYQPLRSWQLGAYVNYHRVETVILPIFEYTYNYPFKRRQGYYGHLGFPKTEVGYFVNPKLRIEAGLFYHQAIVKLAKENPVEPSGYFQSQNWRLSSRLHYQVSKRLEWHLGVQTNVANSLTLYDKSYHQQGEFSAHGGAGINLGFSWYF